MVGLGEKPNKSEVISFSFFFNLFFKWILWDFDFLMFGRKSNIKAEGFLVCVCASEEALGFFEAFQKLLFFLIALLFAIIGFLVSSSDISPLETHYAIFLLFLLAIFVYGLAYVLITIAPKDSECLSTLRFIYLVFGTIAIELSTLIIISPFWLFMVNLGSILIIGVLCSYKQIYQFVSVI